MPSSARLACPLPVVVLLLACGPRHATRAGAERSFDPDRARAEVEWLSDRGREGRGVGTAGGPAAADWIADRFGEAGLAPAFDAGYLQTFEAPFRATLGEGNALAIGSAAPPLGEGWVPFGFSDDGEVEAELVWAGHGITAPEVGHDDYDGLDAKGKVVLVAQDFAREKDPASPFGDPRNPAMTDVGAALAAVIRAGIEERYREWRYKAMNARAHGAAAIIGVRDVWAHDGADELPPWRGQVSSRAGLLAARATAAALLAGGVDVRALAAAGEIDGRPRSRALGVPVRLTVEVRHERAETANVVAVLPGRDPALSGECVVIGAHHDHLGLGGDASLAPDQVGTVHPGADDNASGVAALLAVARATAAQGPARRTILFAAFAAEELGLLGSAHLVRNPPARCAVERMQLMVNLDTVGRPRGGRVYVDGADTARGLRDIVDGLARAEPPLPLRLAFGGAGYGPSDHTSFHARGVPVLFLFTGAHDDYHRPSDTADKVDAEGLAAVARLAARVVRDAAEREGRLELVRAASAPPPPRDRDRGYGAYLGAVPDFAERSEPGVLLAGVRPGSPAERAGLVAGDVLLRVGATRLVGLRELAHALRSHAPGEMVELEWERAGRRIAGTVRLEERR